MQDRGYQEGSGNSFSNECALVDPEGLGKALRWSRELFVFGVGLVVPLARNYVLLESL